MAAVANKSDRVSAIEQSLRCFKTLDAGAKGVICAFHGGKQELYPSQAVRVIKIAKELFNEKGLVWVFDKLKSAFTVTTWHDRDKIYPDEQLEAIETMAKTSLKAGLYALKELKFYDQADEDEHKKCYKDLGQDASFTAEENWKLIECSTRLTTEQLLRPIRIFGDLHGKEAAIRVAKETKNHCKIDTDLGFKQGIENYFREKFGDASAEEIKPHLKYSTRFSEILDEEVCVIS